MLEATERAAVSSMYVYVQTMYNTVYKNHITLMSESELVIVSLTYVS